MQAIMYLVMQMQCLEEDLVLAEALEGEEEWDLEEDFGLGQDSEGAWEIPIHSVGTSHGFPEGGGLACTDQ